MTAVLPGGYPPLSLRAHRPMTLTSLRPQSACCIAHANTGHACRGSTTAWLSLEPCGLGPISHGARQRLCVHGVCMVGGLSAAVCAWRVHGRGPLSGDACMVCAWCVHGRGLVSSTACMVMQVYDGGPLSAAMCAWRVHGQCTICAWQRASWQQLVRGVCMVIAWCVHGREIVSVKVCMVCAWWA